MEENQSSQSIQNQKRNIAVKVTISDIVNSEYKKEDGWTPNFIKTARGEMTRVNIIGIVVSKEENNGVNSLMINDSTGTISLRSFEDNEMLKIPKIGQLVLIIGRPREYNNEKYIMAEIVKKIDDKLWMNVRKKELEIESEIDEILEKNSIINEHNKKVDELKPVIKEPEKNQSKKDELIVTPQINHYEVVLGLIKSMDNGYGVSYEDIILSSKLKNVEDIIKSLIEEGEIFEIRPGILKVL